MIIAKRPRRYEAQAPAKRNLLSKVFGKVPLCIGPMQPTQPKEALCQNIFFGRPSKGPLPGILAEGAIALLVTLSGSALFAS